MSDKSLREQIVDAEWEMMQETRNIGGRANCQEDRLTFYRMRTAQFESWSDEVAESYMQDIRDALAAGRNLVAEKYFNMMKNTHPEEYEAQVHLVPAAGSEKLSLADEICREMMEQTVPIREAYPHVGETGRPLFSHQDSAQATSVQTHQTGELLTYSERTLKLLKNYLFEQKEAGVSLALEITRRSVCSYGFSSLDEAEEFLVAHGA